LLPEQLKQKERGIDWKAETQERRKYPESWNHRERKRRNDRKAGTTGKKD
jgi:hypothetical protein